MKKLLVVILLAITISAGIFLFQAKPESASYGSPPYVEDELSTEQYAGRFGDLSKWKRPEGPVRVGLQAGHWKNSELPDELRRLREAGGGGQKWVRG